MVPNEAANGRNRRLLTALLTLCLLAGCSSSARATPTSAVAGVSATASAGAPGFSRSVSSVNGWNVFQLEPAQRQQQLAAIEAAGVQVVRSDVPWDNIEPVPPTAVGPVFDWAGFDTWVSELASEHLRWEPIIDYSASWAKTCSGFCAPTSDDTYATFAAAVAARYGPGGSFWAANPQLPYYPVQVFEIWNEENVSTYYIAPARYATLYAAARAAIHAVDPTASVIVGGLSVAGSYNPSHDDAAVYVYQMFQADPSLRGAVDGFGLHPYGTNAADTIEWTAHFRQVLDQLGESSTPIDITEFGWITGDAVQEAWRAAQMTAAGLTLSRSDCGIRLLAPYDWISPTATAVEQGGDYGLVDPTGLDTTLRAAGTAWFGALSQAAAMPELGVCGPLPVAPTTPTAHPKPKKPTPKKPKHPKHPTKPKHPKKPRRPNRHHARASVAGGATRTAGAQ